MRKLFPLLVMVVLFGFISIVHAQVEVQCLPIFMLPPLPSTIIYDSVNLTAPGLK